MVPSKLKLGPIELEHPFLVAPMAGITHSPFRRLIRRHGSAAVVSELVSANGIEYASQKTLELLDFDPEERPVGLQIFGEDTDALVHACKLIEKKGADFVDLNMGCPVPKVVKKGGGAAMCRDLPALSKILEAMVRSVKIPVTIKIRTGWDANTRNAVEVVKVAADAGVAWVAIHGRTRAQGYSGEADWDFIGDVKSKSPIPILGNGDVITATQAIDRLKTYGVDAVMIGRGVLRNPFLLEQARDLWSGAGSVAPVETTRYLALIAELRDLLQSAYSERAAGIHARKFLSWFSSGFPGSHEFRKKIFSDLPSASLWSETELFFGDPTRVRDPRLLEAGFLMGGHG
jgi:tRNA-dihydrouridine synthase B